jgi:hypothetical protein
MPPSSPTAAGQGLTCSAASLSTPCSARPEPGSPCCRRLP